MPLFAIGNKNSVESVEQTNFDAERDLQRLVEANLEQLFSCQFIATEFPTGIQHGGRIDTLALSEDNNPVIIEYKKVASSELVTQSLYYLAWIHDHRGDFEMAARKTLGPKVAVDWDEVRVICMAPSYKKFDIHAVQVMGTSLELWTYRLFSNQTLYIEEVQQKELLGGESSGPVSGKNPVMVAAGKKAALQDRHLYFRPAYQRQTCVNSGNSTRRSGIRTRIGCSDRRDSKKVIRGVSDNQELCVRGRAQQECLPIPKARSQEDTRGARVHPTLPRLVTMAPVISRSRLRV
jgi:hypothetical protein